MLNILICIALLFQLDEGLLTFKVSVAAKSSVESGMFFFTLLKRGDISAEFYKSLSQVHGRSCLSHGLDTLVKHILYEI